MTKTTETECQQDTSLWLNNMCEQLSVIVESLPTEPLILGIKTGGVLVAQELHRVLELKQPMGELNISFYRDDFSRIGLHPQVGASNIPFDVDGETIILVDDVIYSGRTVRAAMNEIFDYGRPTRIILATLIERDGHELPIRADVVGQHLQVADGERVKLLSDLTLAVGALE